MSCYCFVWFLAVPSSAPASVGILYKDRQTLPLFEKVGKTENLIDNPARLAAITKITLDTFVDVSVQDSQVYTATYQDTVRSDTLDYSAQIISPLTQWVNLNLGQRYAHAFDISNTLNQNDGSIMNNSEDKTFYRALNAGVAVKNIIADFSAGYAIRRQESRNFLDTYPNGQLAADNYLNSDSDFKHTAGIVLGDRWEVFGSYVTEKYQASY